MINLEYKSGGEIAEGRSLPPGLSRIALAVQYNGANYRGWQRQAHSQPTVQQSLETALSRVADHPVQTVCAGRTDTAVHGSHQVVHFDTSAERPLKAWLMGVNAHLADDVAVRWAHPVVPQFHARFSAGWRQYRYVIYNAPTRPALAYDQMTWVREPLDVDAMATAAQYLLGEQDFSAFRAAGCQAKRPWREVTGVQLRRRGDIITFDVRANAFLYHMVRNFVGSLLEVGKGSQQPPWIAELLAGRDRKLAAKTAPPNGLYLVGVSYDAAFNLPSLVAMPPFWPETVDFSV